MRDNPVPTAWYSLAARLEEHLCAVVIFLVLAQHPQLVDALDLGLAALQLVVSPHDAAERNAPPIHARGVKRLCHGGLTASAAYKLEDGSAVEVRTVDERFAGLARGQDDKVHQWCSIEGLALLVCARRTDAREGVAKGVSGGAVEDVVVRGRDKRGRRPDARRLEADRPGVLESLELVRDAAGGFEGFLLAEPHALGLLVPGVGVAVLDNPFHFFEVGDMRTVERREDVSLEGSDAGHAAGVVVRFARVLDGDQVCWCRDIVMVI